MKSKPFLSKIRSVFDRAGAYCTENPLKVYAGIYVLGDLVIGTNPNGHWLWAAGALVSVAANTNKIVFGKGGDAVDPSSFRITKASLCQTAYEVVQSPFQLFAPDNLREVWQSLKAVKPRNLVKKARRAMSFWRYPLDAGWLMYFGTGSSYALDSLCLGPSRPVDAFIGVFGAAASAIGFATDNNKVVGQMFGCLSLYLLTVGITTRNPALVGSSVVYLYGNHAMSRAISARQSGYTVKQQEASPA